MSGTARPRTQRAPHLEGEDMQLVALHSLWEQSVGHAQTTIGDRQDVMRRFRHVVGVPLTAVTPAQCATWQMSLAGMKPNSIAIYVRHVRGFYLWARKHKHVPEDPTVDVLQAPRAPKGVPRPVPDDQIRTALACANPKMRAILALMAFAGLRCGEVVGLRREDIRDTDAVPVLFVHGKGNKDRVVPAPEMLLQVLRAYGLPPSGVVILNHLGRPYTSNRLSQVVSEFLHSINIRYSAHKLRHAFGTSAYRLSGDLLLTQQLMGHSSPATTQGYVQVAATAAVELSDQMNDRARELFGEGDADGSAGAVPAQPNPPPPPTPLAGARPVPSSGYGHGLRLIRGGAA